MEHEPDLKNSPSKSPRFERAPEHLIREGKIQTEAVRKQHLESLSGQDRAAAEPKWTPFERAPEESVRQAKEQIKAVRRQYLESLSGRDRTKMEPDADMDSSSASASGSSSFVGLLLE